MPNRLELQTLLEDILGSRNVYFQPPESLKINYPAIVYGLENIDSLFANNRVYSSRKAYALTVIDEDPDSLIVDKIVKIPTCRFNRHFKSDNLNHNVFTINY